MKNKWILAFLMNASVSASGVTPLPVSYGALLYDFNYPSGPGSHPSIDPGMWASDISAFNAGATPNNSITRLYPYSSDIEITCTSSSCSIDPGYSTGNASVSSYRAQFPNAIIMPIIDIAFKYLQNGNMLTDTNLATNVAQAIVAQLCADPNADGVYFDLEAKGGLSNPGLRVFYTQMSSLLSKAPCVHLPDHPNGRYMGIYLTPTATDWSYLQAAFAQNKNSFLAIPLYDVKGFTNPPTPDPLNGPGSYTSAESSALKSAQTNAIQYKVAYTIILPAGASFGTFAEYGIYNSGFQLITDYSTNNTPQSGYIAAARNAACSNNNAYFMGMDYWSWQQYISPGQNSDGSYQLVMPNTPDSASILYLQKSASCG